MERHDRVRHLAAFAVAAAAALAAEPRASAQAGSEKAAAAQALFDEGMRLMKDEQNAQACPKLEESLRLDPAMGTEFRLAECYEKVGKLASAWAKFVSVADAAALARQTEREAVARERAAALVPRLPHLSIAVPPAVASLPGLDVQRDGAPVGKALWGVAVPVDPGEHVVTAQAPGKKVWEGRVTASAPASLVVAVQPLDDLPTVAAPPKEPPPPARRGRSAAPAIVLGGLGVVGLGVGAGLFAAHASASSGAEALSAQIKATGDTCAPGAKRFDAQCGALAGKASSSDTFGNASTAAFVVGGALVAATAVYLLWPAAPQPPASGKGPPPPFQIHLSPALGGDLRGLFATGSF